MCVKTMLVAINHVEMELIFVVFKLIYFIIILYSIQSYSVIASKILQVNGILST